VEQHIVTAPSSGVLTRLDAYAVGVAAWRLGAGRARKEDPVSPGAGVVLLAKPGDTVRQGQPLLELHADDPGRFDRALQALEGGYDIAGPKIDGSDADGGTAFQLSPLVLDRVTA
jgi:thymidine phosphorylase